MAVSAYRKQQRLSDCALNRTVCFEHVRDVVVFGSQNSGFEVV